jgi:SAM-dependent methyltransferase
MSSPTATRPFLDEPLGESAVLAHRLAGERCRVQAMSRESCAWYHGFWQFMRLMGIAKTSGGHVDFLAKELRVAARSGRFAHLLIAGAADYSMAACALWAYRLEGAELGLSMVDRCDTPLALARWYGARCGASMKTHCADILDFESPQKFDVVMTNSFLGYFDPPARAKLFARWANLLRPGGRLLLTNRIRPGTGHVPVGFTPDEARAFADTVRREAARLPTPTLEPDELVRMAQAYADRFRSVPLHSSAEIVALIEANGFRIERLDTATATGRADGALLAGPTLAEATDYVRAVAVRS